MKSFMSSLIALGVAAGLLGSVALSASADMKSTTESAKEKTKAAGEKVKEKAVEAKDKVKAKLHREPTAREEGVRTAQKRLAELGYNAGPADGVIGPKTHAGIADFQRDHNLPVTGQLDKTTLAALDNASGTASASPRTGSPAQTQSSPATQSR